MSAPPPKMLLVFCDGTGQDGLVSLGREIGGGPGAPQNASNIVRLSRAIKPTRTLSNGQTMEQVVYYQSGVGSLTDFYGQDLVENKKIAAYGITVASKIRDAYVYIANNYVAGDQICIFGFSRGAYIARKVAGLIDRIGLLSRERMGEFFKIWIALVKNTQPQPPPPIPPIPIKCVGVFDTVGSVYDALIPPHEVIDALSIKDTSLPSNVENAFHALSLQENRKKFMCTLWTVPPGGLPNGHILKQQWFPGCHSDTGGSYPRHELGDLALFWMAGEVSALIAVDLDFVQHCREVRPDADWGKTQPNNSYYDSSLIVRQFVGHQTRLEGNQVTRDSVLHPSIEGAPTTLTKPLYMITLNGLKTAFGSGWRPNWAPLNAFEEKCKREWKNKLEGRRIPTFENPWDFADLLNEDP